MTTYYLWFPTREEADAALLPFIYPDDAGQMQPGSDIADIVYLPPVMQPTGQTVWDEEQQEWVPELRDVGGQHVNWWPRDDHALPEELEMYNWPTTAPRTPSLVWA